jgi:hypothetical protein
MEQPAHRNTTKSSMAMSSGAPSRRTHGFDKGVPLGEWRSSFALNRRRVGLKTHMVRLKADTTIRRDSSQ